MLSITSALFLVSLLMTCGLAWFFTEAWIFALKAKAGWLLVLLGFTSTIVVFTQSYLCFVMISNRRVMDTLSSLLSLDKDSPGVTPSNREAFASFCFDRTTCLTRRVDPDDRPSIGWKLCPSLLSELDPTTDDAPPGTQQMLSTGCCVDKTASGLHTVNYSEDGKVENCAIEEEDLGRAVVARFSGDGSDSTHEEKTQMKHVQCTERRVGQDHEKVNEVGGGYTLTPAEAERYTNSSQSSWVLPPPDEYLSSAGSVDISGRSSCRRPAARSRGGVVSLGDGNDECDEVENLDRGQSAVRGNQVKTSRMAMLCEVGTDVELGPGVGPPSMPVLEADVELESREHDMTTRSYEKMARPRREGMKCRVAGGVSWRVLEEQHQHAMDDSSSIAEGGHCNDNGLMITTAHPRKDAPEAKYHCSKIMNADRLQQGQQLLHHQADSDRRANLSYALTAHTEAPTDAPIVATATPSTPCSSHVVGHLDTYFETTVKQIIQEHTRERVSAISNNRDSGAHYAATGGATGDGVVAEVHDDRLPSGGRLAASAIVRVNELSDMCAICLGHYETGEPVHVLPCLHMFHAQCLDVWIEGHPSCPYCKTNLNVLPATEQERIPNSNTVTPGIERGGLTRILHDASALISVGANRLRYYIPLPVASAPFPRFVIRVREQFRRRERLRRRQRLAREERSQGWVWSASRERSGTGDRSRPEATGNALTPSMRPESAPLDQPLSLG